MANQDSSRSGSARRGFDFPLFTPGCGKALMCLGRRDRAGWRSNGDPFNDIREPL